MLNIRQSQMKSISTDEIAEVTTLNRFKCAGTLMLRGLSAPVIHPILGVFDFASESFSDRSGLLLNIASNGMGAGFAAVFGGLAGLATGAATLANALGSELNLTKH
jgi:hypothetical protein